MKAGRLLSLIIRLLSVACLLSLLGYLGRYFFLFEQIDSFRAQYFIVSSAGLLLALSFRRWVSGLTLLCVCLLHGSELARFYLPASAPQSTPIVRVMSVNLLASNRVGVSLLDEIEKLNPDVIVFQEYTSRWHRILTSELTVYPYKVYEVIDSPFGIAAYSKIPFSYEKIDYFNQHLSPAVNILIDNGLQKMRILGIHPIPPMSSPTFAMRNQYFEDVLAEVSGVNEPLVVLGDFNATPWSFHFKKLLKQAGLKSTRDGFGLHPTWPAGFWPLWTPIDHILHNEKFELIHFDTGSHFGSDHIPVWADLAIAPD